MHCSLLPLSNIFCYMIYSEFFLAPWCSDQMSPSLSLRLLITNALPHITLLQQHTRISRNMYAVAAARALVTHCGPRSHSQAGELLPLLSVSSELLPKFSFVKLWLNTSSKDSNLEESMADCKKIYWLNECIFGYILVHLNLNWTRAWQYWSVCCFYQCWAE